MERRIETKNYKVEYICDKCGMGKMVSTGLCQMTYPARYEHECTKCGEKKYFIGKSYPYVEYTVDETKWSDWADEKPHEDNNDNGEKEGDNDGQ